MTFSSTLGAGSGVERTTRVESQETSKSLAASTTSSHADPSDADDIVSEFLSQINHDGVVDDGPNSLVADVYDLGHCQQRPSLNGVHDGPHHPEIYADGGMQPAASFIYEPDSKLHSYGGGDGELLPAGLSASGSGGDTGGGPAAETLKKMAALHRRLEQKTAGSGPPNQLLSASDYERGYAGSRHALYTAPYQLPVTYCTGNSRCGMTYGAGASKPLSHYPTTAAGSTLAVAYPQYGQQAPESQAAGAGATGNTFYMTQSQCVDFRLSHPGVRARAMMSQSAAVRSSSPYRAQTPSSATGWTRVRYPYPQPRYPCADDRSSWISSPYGRAAESRNPSAPTTGNGSENQGRVFQAYRGSQEQSFAVVTGDECGLQPPPPYSDFVRQKQRPDRKWNQPTAESRWRRRPWTRHHDFVRTINPDVAVTPVPITPASGHMTSADVEFAVADEPIGQEFFFDMYASSNAAIDNTDLSFIEDIFTGP